MDPSPSSSRCISGSRQRQRQQRRATTLPVKSMSSSLAILVLVLVAGGGGGGGVGGGGGGASAFQCPSSPPLRPPPTTKKTTTTTTTTTTRRHSTQLDKGGGEIAKDESPPPPRLLPVDGHSTAAVGGGPSSRPLLLREDPQPPNNDVVPPVLLDYSSYEHALLSAWDEPSSQRGFDWEIEKVRRFFAGLRRDQSTGAWVRTPSIFDFLVTHSPSRVVGYDATANGGGIGTRYEPPPKPVNPLDVAVLITKNLLNGLGFGPSLGMAAVPNAIIQKYEGSYLTFIRGVLGGDLQTLAGGPLFLLLAKYYKDYGPIFNLSFGPKSFLVISDPVMARHILRDSSPEQYCKGMLAEILEPIMGDGLIPADPKIWKVSSWLVRSGPFFGGGIRGERKRAAAEKRNRVRVHS